MLIPPDCIMIAFMCNAACIIVAAEELVDADIVDDWYSRVSQAPAGYDWAGRTSHGGGQDAVR